MIGRFAAGIGLVQRPRVTRKHVLGWCKGGLGLAEESGALFLRTHWGGRRHATIYGPMWELYWVPFSGARPNTV